MRRPLHSGAIGQERPLEATVGIGDCRSIRHRPDPVNLERDRGGYVDWILGPEQGIRDIEKIEKVQVLDVQRGGPFLEVDLNVIGFHPNSPEQALRVGSDARVEIMNLSCEICEVKLTSIEVKSNKGESTSVQMPVNANVYAFHEPHIRVEQQSFRRSVGIGRGTRALDIRRPNLPLEVGDGAQL
jgi:hypothetical protein